MKTLNRLLTTAMGSFFGVWLGRTLYTYVDYRLHPRLYAMNSAPWYTGPQVGAILTVIIECLLLCVKIFVKRRLKRQG